MRGLSECKIAGKTFTVRELTYPQVLQQIKGIKDREEEPTGLDWLFGKSYMPLETLTAIVGEDVEAFMVEQQLAPSEIVPLYKEAVEVNPFLAGALAQMREIAAMMRLNMMSLTTNLSQLFGASPASSSAGATDGQKNTESPISLKP